MPTIQEVEFKYELAKQGHVLNLQVRAEVQARVDAASDQTIKDILIIAVIQLDTIITEEERFLAECEHSISEYYRRIEALNQ